jgi:hypothetical protein
MCERLIAMNLKSKITTDYREINLPSERTMWGTGPGGKGSGAGMIGIVINSLQDKFKNMIFPTEIVSLNKVMTEDVKRIMDELPDFISNNKHLFPLPPPPPRFKN